NPANVKLIARILGEKNLEKTNHIERVILGHEEHPQPRDLASTPVRAHRQGDTRWCALCQGDPWSLSFQFPVSCFRFLVVLLGPLLPTHREHAIVVGMPSPLARRIRSVLPWIVGVGLLAYLLAPYSKPQARQVLAAAFARAPLWAPAIAIIGAILAFAAD